MTLPVALSLLMNGVLFGLLARSFMASSAPAEVYFAVELRQVAPISVHASPPKPRQSPAPSEKRPVEKQQAAAGSAQAGSPRAQVPNARPGPPRETRAAAVPTSSASPVSSGVSAVLGWGPGEFIGSGEGGGSAGQGVRGAGTDSGTGVGAGVGDGHGGEAHGAGGGGGAPKGESRGPQAIEQPRPSYPTDARDEGVEGTVVLLASIAADGHVDGVKVESSSGDRRLDRAAAGAVERWTYSPCLKEGVPAASAVRVCVQFKLE